MRGIFMTFEGIEGSGKTTLVAALAERLRARGVHPLLTREPGGTDLGRAVRGILLDPASGKMVPAAELLLFAADRAQHVAEVIRPALEAGRVVLCDRFSDATTAYQACGRGLPAEAVAAVDAIARGGLSPDLTVLMDIDPSIGLARARRRNLEADGREARIDEETQEFFSRVRDGYLALARREPSRFLVLDATRPPDNLVDEAQAAIARRLPGAF